MSDVDLQQVFLAANKRARTELTTRRQIRKARLTQLQSEGGVQSSGRAQEEQQKWVVMIAKFNFTDLCT